MPDKKHYIKVKVKTGSKKESIEQVRAHVYNVSVKEQPQDNRANHRVLELMTLHLALPRNALRIVSGHHRRSKLLEVIEEKQKEGL